MAHHIKTTGEVIPIEPKNGRDFSLEELQGFVGGGGYIEIIPVLDGLMVVSEGEPIITRNQVMVVNEDGKIIGLAANILATGMAHQLIVGDVLLCKRREVR